jgi:O-antigen/teichoic acid export membrane protein
MSSFLKKLASDTAIYGISSILGRFLNYVLVPFHTGIFKPEEYGIVSVFYAYAALLNVVYTYGFETAYFRFATKKAANSQGVLENAYPPDQIYRVALTSILGSSLLLSGLLMLFAPYVASWLGYENATTYLYWFALILAIDAIVAIPFARLRLKNKAKKFATLRSLNIVLNVGLNYFFLYFLKNAHEQTTFSLLEPLAHYLYDPELGLGYVFLANLIANLCFIPLLASEWRDFRFQILPTIWKSMFKYAYPILFIGIAYTTMSVADRTFLERWLPPDLYPDKSNLDVVGIYSACYKFSIFINLAVQAFKYAAEPFFFAQAESKDSPRRFALITDYFLVACLLMFLFISLNVGWISHILISQAAYREGILVVPILLLANTFLGLYYNISVAFKVSDRTHLGIYTTLLGAAVSVLANYLLIPHWGYMGSAVATFGAYAAMLTLAYRLGQKYFPVPYPVGKMSVLVLVSTAVVGIGYALIPAIYTSPNPLDYLLPNALVILLCALWWKLGRGKI